MKPISLYDTFQVVKRVNKELAECSIGELAPLIKSKSVSPVEILESVFGQIKMKNNILNAYIETFEEEARSVAKQAEEDIRVGQYRGPLHGIPMATKANLYIKGKNINIGSYIHKDFVPDYHATVINKLRHEGVVLTGILNMHEYAYGFTTDNPYYGTCRNPWDVDKIPGGSSGGSASAVSSDMIIASLGSETGGSLRAPASFCGIVSIKPTYGRVSKYGCFPMAWTLDHVGPMTKTVEDSAILLQAMAGHDPKDPSTADIPVDDYLSYLNQDVNGMVIGINEKHLFSNVDKEVGALVRSAIKQLEQMGAKIELIDFSTLDNALFAMMMTMASEATTIHHENLVKRPQDFGIEVRTELQFGETISAVDYLQAQQLRRQIIQEFNDVFSKVDVIVGPTLPFTASPVGSDFATLNGEKVKLAEHASRYIRPTTLAGIPAMTVPCGLSEGLPVGMQILSGPFQEGKIFKVASAVESLHLMEGKKPATSIYS
mgnify:CR=1 FL=1